MEKILVRYMASNQTNGGIEYFMNATDISAMIGDIESALDAILGV